MPPAERGFLNQQAAASAEAIAELNKIAQRQTTEANATQALSGVNAGMWASYMSSFNESEAPEQASTTHANSNFQFDPETGLYKDAKAGLWYDAKTTFFFTVDKTKYFLYCHEEKMLCLVDKSGKKLPGGERRPLPGQASSPNDGSRQGAEKRQSSEAATGLQAIGKAGKHEVGPIYFPGGDPLAKLAPQAPAATAQQPAQAKKKKRPPQQEDMVLGLAKMPKGVKRIPGKVVVLAKPGAAAGGGVARLGPVTVMSDMSASSGAQPDLFDPFADAGGPSAGGVVVNDWICEVCMRRFSTQEQLRRHEDLSDLHKQNLAKLQSGVLA
eukprot:TRINITY_DN14653_c0_g1_i1.p1 TRINITY_DN14653_c0_g1~~TRINITY_DN14653_c0_g1_i1.p1  ORF type:complete len:326 (+),score=109.25 TRINITY_DN14653_c0_g1_i1:1398-2375(+)